MKENELKILKSEHLKKGKIAVITMICEAVVLLGIMIAWLVVRAKNQTAMIVLSVIAGVIILSIIGTYFLYRAIRNKEREIQLQIDKK